MEIDRERKRERAEGVGLLAGGKVDAGVGGNTERRKREEECKPRQRFRCRLVVNGV